jgi:hypothetical protein
MGNTQGPEGSADPNSGTKGALSSGESPHDVSTRGQMHSAGEVEGGTAAGAEESGSLWGSAGRGTHLGWGGTGDKG